MKLDYIPLLKVQRELYEIPRGMGRFRAYLAALTDPETGDLALPLPAMNPMAKDHVPRLLDQYLEIDADSCAAQAVSRAEPLLSATPGSFRITLVMSDDAAGGWTNRYSSEFNSRFATQSLFKRGWIVGILWSSEPASVVRTREEVLTAVYRADYIQRHGHPKSLGQMLRQEGYAMSRAGCSSLALTGDEAELDYTREIISSHMATDQHSLIMACLFGDDAASALGYSPLGLGKWAGLALALHDACSARGLGGAAG